MLVLTAPIHIEASRTFPEFRVITSVANEALWPSAVKKIFKTALFAEKR
jgi:hypothetical protein